MARRLATEFAVESPSCYHHRQPERAIWGIPDQVRRAKVGGYRDYFTDEEVAAIDDLVATRLAPEFGYAAVSAGPEVDPPR